MFSQSNGAIMYIIFKAKLHLFSLQLEVLGETYLKKKHYIFSHTEHIPRVKHSGLLNCSRMKNQRKKAQKQPKRSLWLWPCHFQLSLHLLNNNDTKSSLFPGTAGGTKQHIFQGTLIGLDPQRYKQFTAKWEPKAKL